MPTSTSRLQLILNLTIVFITAAILVALLLPQPQWASTGIVDATIQLIVTDLDSQTPVSGASVRIMKTGWLLDDLDAQTIATSMNSSQRDPEHAYLTDENREALIPQTFSTGASDKIPISHADKNRYCVLVAHPKYGSVMMPLRYAKTPSRELINIPLRVIVGLAK